VELAYLDNLYFLALRNNSLTGDDDFVQHFEVINEYQEFYFEHV